MLGLQAAGVGGSDWVHELWGMAVWLGLGHPARVCEPQGLGVGSPVGPGLPGALGLPYNRCQVCKLWGAGGQVGPGLPGEGPWACP